MDPKDVEYGRWPNGLLVGRVPGALPLAMLRKAVGHGFLAKGHVHHSLGQRPRMDHVGWFFGQRPYSIARILVILNMAVGQTV